MYIIKEFNQNHLRKGILYKNSFYLLGRKIIDLEQGHLIGKAIYDSKILHRGAHFLANKDDELYKKSIISKHLKVYLSYIAILLSITWDTIKHKYFGALFIPI